MDYSEKSLPIWTKISQVSKCVGDCFSWSYVAKLSSNTTEVNANFTIDYIHTGSHLLCSVIVNNTTRVNRSIVNYTIQNSVYSAPLTNLSIGKNSWHMNCYDHYGASGYSENYTFFILSNMTSKNDTESFDVSALDDITNVSNYYMKHTYARINWTANLDLSDNLDWLAHVNISHNRIEINSSAASALNKSARIALYNLTWSNPRVLKDGVVCTNCSIASYNRTSGELVFNVTGFSVYTTDETPVASSGSSSGGGGRGNATNATAVSEANNTNENATLNLSVLPSLNNTPSLNNSLSEDIKRNDSESTVPITVAVIGAAVKRYALPIVVLLVVIALAAGLVRYRRKRQFS